MEFAISKSGQATLTGSDAPAVVILVCLLQVIASSFHDELWMYKSDSDVHRP